MSVRRIRRLIAKAVVGILFVLAMIIINGVSAPPSKGVPAPAISAGTALA